MSSFGKTLLVACTISAYCLFSLASARATEEGYFPDSEEQVDVLENLNTVEKSESVGEFLNQVKRRPLSKDDFRQEMQENDNDLEMEFELDHILQKRSSDDSSSDKSNSSDPVSETPNDVPMFQGPPGRDGQDGRDEEAGEGGLAGDIECPAGSPGSQRSRGSKGPLGLLGETTANPSTIYIRWGRTVCPLSATLAYAGFAGGKWWAHTGSGSNLLCLPEDPEYDDYQAGVDPFRAYIYSAEYEVYSDFPPYAGKHDLGVPCAVCRTTNRGSMMMIPAKKSCPFGWTREYHGYLMAERYNHSGTEFLCVDRCPENVVGSNGNQDGVLFFPVESRLPGPPGYIDGAELACVVCTK